MEDQSLSAAIAAEYWTWFPPVVARSIARELTRLASHCYFLGSAQAAVSLPDALGPAFTCRRIDLAANGARHLIRVERTGIV
jgi:hypothetical protein